MGKSTSDKGLSRTMGLTAAASIGIGTMLGAGIFVFPGIAGGQAGSSAIISFFLAGLIAIIVAICTAELSTAMPKSGGAYFFVSRTFGAFWGTITGISLWLGLVFACAFYLAGFAEYFNKFLGRIGFSTELGIFAFALPATLLLLLINVFGTKNVGKFQNSIVISLTGLLVFIYIFGLWKIFSGSELNESFSSLFSEGKSEILPTAALIFTSYLGFVQISTVAGEVKKPSKNLPLALIGSVIIVMILYVFVLFVTTQVFSMEQLQSYGESATVEVAEKLIGRTGVIIVLFSGLLATLSSANASMMSSSRSIFALSKDSLVPKTVGSINDRFRTPHFSLLLVAIPIIMLFFLSDLTFFAEVASFLHLVIYMAICVALFRLKDKQPAWFEPKFKFPGSKILSIIGAVSCLVLIFFMEWKSIGAGLAIVILSSFYYFIFQKGTKISTPSKEYSKPALLERVMIPIDLTSEKPIDLPHDIIDILRSSEVLILGYESIPEQSDPEGEENEEKELKNRMNEFIDNQNFTADVESETVRTKNLTESISQTIEKYRCKAILTARPITGLNRILIPIYSRKQLTENLKEILEQLQENDEKINTEILLIPGEELDSADKDPLNNELSEFFGEAQINWDYMKNDGSNKEERMNAADIMKKSGGEKDIILLSESDTSYRESFFNTVHRSIEKSVTAPIIVILKEHESHSEN